VIVGNSREEIMVERNEYGVITPFGAYMTHELETAHCIQQKHVYLRRLADEVLAASGATPETDPGQLSEAVLEQMTPTQRKGLGAELLSVFATAVVKERQRMRSIRGGT
jgi:hypothetical protein